MVNTDEDLVDTLGLVVVVPFCAAAPTIPTRTSHVRPEVLFLFLPPQLGHIFAFLLISCLHSEHFTNAISSRPFVFLFSEPTVTAGEQFSKSVRLSAYNIDKTSRFFNCAGNSQRTIQTYPQLQVLCIVKIAVISQFMFCARSSRMPLFK